MGQRYRSRALVGDGTPPPQPVRDPVLHYEPPGAAFVMVDHLAFRTGTLDHLRALRAQLVDAGVDGVLTICHGNAWSLYFHDCEGNGVECFVDTPFHVAQPFAQGFDLDQGDEAILEATRKLVEGEPEHQPLSTWRAAFAKRIGQPPSRTAAPVIGSSSPGR